VYVSSNNKIVTVSTTVDEIMMYVYDLSGKSGVAVKSENFYILVINNHPPVNAVLLVEIGNSGQVLIPKIYIGKLNVLKCFHHQMK
jgi:hypothetical protein